MLIPKRRTSVTVIIPSSATRDIPHLREKTLRLGFVGRALAIFRVDNILIYKDRGRDDSKFIEKILTYMSSPQYVRRRIFKLTPELKYVGILPPLRTPNHPLKKPVSELRIGEIREGVVVKTLGNRSIVDIGLDSPAEVRNSYPVNTVLNVKITGIGRTVEAEPISLDEIPYFWCFKVKAVNQSIEEIAKDEIFDMTVATSRNGEPIETVAGELAECWMKSRNVLIAFGSPTEGIEEILGRKKLSIKNLFDFTVNTIKDQGTKTVRLEEAITASLAVFNYLTT